ncbi:RHS repeat domain-containing protein [Neisseria zalophi]|uniref:RHS repeat domain-containing protein n=1 Tax=Neisseria zalophi TaxID=640030 RepID=UPI0029811709|nr:RHS repeat-associated core domain-containing protein [Neisseria zalophi]
MFGVRLSGEGLFRKGLRLSEKKQIAELNAVTQPKGKNKTAAGHTAVKRSYGYDKTGNLIHSSDQRSGVTQFEYDKLGRITQADKETFAFDPAHNILSDGLKDKIADNRLKTYNGISYYYDDLGNLIHRELVDGEVQNYFYDLHDQLVKVEIFKPEQEKETWVYTYDALGRRIGKGRLKNGQEVSDGLEDKTDFTWDGSHLIQETRSDGLYTYIYTDKDAYEPLAQIRNWTNKEGESYQETNYFHCNQIGIPREMTDKKDGNLLWFGDYFGWGKLKSETNITGAHQPLRLQNQYCDQETGLHYNFFRYYEPECGRFVNQDPIGLWGGSNFYGFAPNTQIWVDVLGWHASGSWGTMRCQMNKTGSNKFRTFTGYSSEAGGRGARHPLIKKMFKKHKRDARSGKCVEADILNQIADEFNIKTEAKLKKFLTDHKCSAIQVTRNIDQKALAPCPNCAPVVGMLGV